MAKKPGKYEHIHPLHAIHKAHAAGVREVIVGVSGGKDSIVTLDLCRKHFDRVAAFFMYVVPNLEFQEQYLRYLERKTSIDIMRVPHWMLSSMLKCGLRHRTRASVNLRRVTIRHVEAYVRERVGDWFIATGEKRSDSLERNAQILQCDGFNPDRRRVYPLAYWTHTNVENYLAKENFLLPPDYRLRPAGSHRGSFGNLLTFDELLPIQQHYPEDFAKIVKMFPKIDIQLQRHEQLNKRRPDLVNVKTVRKAKQPASEATASKICEAGKVSEKGEA